MAFELRPTKRSFGEAVPRSTSLKTANDTVQSHERLRLDKALAYEAAVSPGESQNPVVCSEKSIEFTELQSGWAAS